MLEVLQIIWEVIFREPDPNTVQFIEPITLMAIAAGAKGLGSIIQGRQAKKAAERQAELDREMAQQAQAEADTQIADALARQSEYGLAPTYNELRKTVMEDPAADLQRQEALRSEAEQVQALKTGGARALLGGLSKVDASTADRFAKIAADESARRKAGLQTIAGAEQQVETYKYQQAGQDLASARNLREQALGAEAGAAALENRGRLAQSQAITSGITGMISDGFNIAASQMDGGGGDTGSVNVGGTTVTADQGVPGLFDALNQINVTPQPTLNLPDEDEELFAEEGGLVKDASGIEGRMLSFEEGAMLMRGITPGEFSHDSNPIDIMKDGVKIGEMSGGEGVVSPKDLGEWEQESVRGNTKLHKKLRAWFKRMKNKKNV
jgi:hypothetical protein